jgi:DNA (cytosine-5)-methyltransferase 1
MVEVQPDSNTRLVESKKRVAVNVKVVSSLRDFARSYAANWPPPAPATEESAAVDILKREWRNRSEHCPSYEGYESKKPMLIADLHDFEIFRSPLAGKGTRKFELTSLHLMETPTHKKLCFDGFLCVGDVKLYAKGMPIQNFSIEGYGDKESPETVTYLRSELASKDRDYDIWYRLNKPSQAYQRYHEPFLSIAELAKHVIDYIEEQPLGSVGLESFRKDFQEWLKARFSQNPAIEKWHLGFQNRTDFRVDVNAYIGFLYLEALSLPNSDALLRHPLWADCMARGLTAVEKQDQLEEYTVASPDVYKDFRDMYFGKKLKVMPTTEAVKRRQVRRKIRLGFATNEPPSAYAVPRCRPYRDSQIQIGDVVAFDPKEHDKVSWRNANWEWLACVQSIQPLNNGAQRLFVLFMYRPRETNIFNAKYSFDNELFFSDNCNCTDGELLSTDIKGKYEIDWLPKKIESNKGFFVRQTYLTQQSAFVSFKDDHKLCDCKKTKVYPLEAYHLGDTVYITKTVGGERILEPVVIRHTDKATGTVTVRRLSRLSRDCAQLAREAKRTADIADNELALTDDYVKVLASRIQRRCQVRFVPKQDVLRGKVPFPYNRGGAGDCWFISMGIISSEGGSRLKYLTRLPERFNESEGLAAICGVEKLKGLSMFSGGGNLDRGLEEGGVVEFRYAIDLDPQAIHTQRANAKDFTRLNLYYGSVDDYMKLVLSGIKHDHVARIGDVEFIAAGSPCPGTKKTLHAQDRQTTYTLSRLLLPSAKYLQ